MYGSIRKSLREAAQKLFFREENDTSGFKGLSCKAQPVMNYPGLAVFGVDAFFLFVDVDCTKADWLNNFSNAIEIWQKK